MDEPDMPPRPAWFDEQAGERQRLYAAPTVVEQVPGGWRVEKGGIVGVGPTRDAAFRDLGEKFWVTISRPPAG